MSQKIKPLGSKLIVLPIEKQNEVSVGGIELVNLILQYGQVVEVGTEVEDVYKEGDIIIYPQERGNAQQYQKKNMLWLNGLPFSSTGATGDVWGIVTEEDKKKED